MKALAMLVRKDLKLYFSSPRTLAITLAAPILIAAFFGAVMGGAPKKPSKVPVALVNQDTSEVARDMVATMRKDDAFLLQEVDEPAALTLVRSGKVRAGVVIPAGFGEAAPRAMFQPQAKKPEIIVHYDPSQSIALQLVKGLLMEHVMKAVSKATFGGGPSSAKFLQASRADVVTAPGVTDAQRKDLLALFDSVERVNASSTPAAGQGGGLGGGEGMTTPFTMASREVTTGDRKYNPYAHAFAGMGVQFILFSGIELGVGILMMRRMGLWKRLRAAPVSRTLLIGSRVASGALISLFMLLAIYLAAILVFGVRIEGSIVGFVLVGLSFAIMTASFGLLIAAVGKTPEAARGIAILATLLLVMLGGAWVPTFVFPEWMQTATLVVPTRWAVDGLEAMTWRGLGLEAALAPTAVMLAFSAVFALIAMKRFDWEE